ncbi:MULTISPECIES: Uma2 family endonuclease [unclassified Arcicella]|uniref:Uma2 family endonuclease n=1 Tax=unclassified Arcicella TaxID=2644986 RepID=UPI002859FD8C|nr:MULTISPECIES: Uma2 family endonuclease [unclassified Arcicella]MDR6561584.1 Uma2 family endonuclease [Arcicella sp. BE51]MDR6812364.1 Uma2 family endonuclease [Arcicella sp. BE140]MDR6823864.1 Uma2 family endonuclease [Arcicella sp. BE139]
MVVAKNIKETILSELNTQQLVRIPASEEEYFSVVADLPFKIEYHENEIITMGLASYWHEKITATFIGLLFQLFNLKKDDYDILGSNSGVQIPKFEGGYYMPDVMVVKGSPIFKANSRTIITNPYIIVEVLSPATKAFDLSEKLSEYKLLSSLQQVIYINPEKVTVSTFIRSDNPNTWINQDFYSLEDSITVEGNSILVSDIYHKIKFEE